MSDGGWVLLLGGGGGVGKSYVATRIARRQRASVLQADDIRLVLQQAIPASVEPRLHAFLGDGVREREPGAAVAAQLEIGRLVSDLLGIVIRHHLAAGDRIVIEGDSILPSLVPADPRVRGVFIEEPEAERVTRALAERGRGSSDVAHRAWWAEFHHLHGRELAALARAAGVPVVLARPRSTLATRVEAAAGL